MTNEPKQTFHRRELRPPGIGFSTVEGKALFSGALASGHAEIFFPLMESYNTQSAPAFCGLASLSMAMNALLIDPGRTWSGVWRWFDDSMLDCCDPLEVIKLKGVTLPKLHCLAKCNGAVSKLTYGPDIDVNAFRELVIRCCSIEDGEQMILIASYSRQALNQTGSGHFSPIGAYNRERDMALILDTARFKFPPHWVPLESLHAAMLENDMDTMKPRGFLTIRCSTELRQMCCSACDEEKVEVEEEENETGSDSDRRDRREESKRMDAMKACANLVCDHLDNCPDCSAEERNERKKRSCC